MSRKICSETGGRFRLYRRFKSSPTAQRYILNSVTEEWSLGFIVDVYPYKLSLADIDPPKPPASERISQL